MTDKKKKGLRQKVKEGIIGIDEAILLASEYDESIRAWLARRKTGNIKPKKEDTKKKKKKYKKKSRKN